MAKIKEYGVLINFTYWNLERNCVLFPYLYV